MDQNSVRRNGDEGSTGRVQERKRMCRLDLRTEKCGGAKKQGLKTVIALRKAHDTVWQEDTVGRKILWKQMRG